ncbi:proteoglycan 4-like isoform X2 [Daktulosphaira vitifoliae]|uniref:proteoglycan 4-like isoform X2 n=1 Tax=Daktulosphaira vitifoliae TaxID=58002 RepID=UPI0021A9F306|nr:proteoglycan 4-like isoform X2 [Daktulosphaira vitifoliae]
MNSIGYKSSAGGNAFVVLTMEPIPRGLPPTVPLSPPPPPPPPPVNFDVYKTRPRKPTRKERTAFVILPEPPPTPSSGAQATENDVTPCSGRVSPFRAYGFKTPEGGRSRASSPRPLRRQASDTQISQKNKKTIPDAPSLTDTSKRLSVSTKDLTTSSRAATIPTATSTPKLVKKPVPLSRKPPASPSRSKAPQFSPKSPLPPRSDSPSHKSRVRPNKPPVPLKSTSVSKSPAKRNEHLATGMPIKSPTKPKSQVQAVTTNVAQKRSSPVKSPRPIKKLAPASVRPEVTKPTVKSDQPIPSVKSDLPIAIPSTTVSTTPIDTNANAVLSETITRTAVIPVTATPMSAAAITRSIAVTNSEQAVTTTATATDAPLSPLTTAGTLPAHTSTTITISDQRSSVMRPAGSFSLTTTATWTSTTSTITTTATTITAPSKPKPTDKPPASETTITPSLSYVMRGIKMNPEALNQSGAGQNATTATLMGVTAALRKTSTTNGHKSVAWARQSDKIIEPEPKVKPSCCGRFVRKFCCVFKCCPTCECGRKCCGSVERCASVWKRRPRFCWGSSKSAINDRRCSSCWPCRYFQRLFCCYKKPPSKDCEQGVNDDTSEDLATPSTFVEKLKLCLSTLCCCCCCCYSSSSISNKPSTQSWFRRCCCYYRHQGDTPIRSGYRRRKSLFSCSNIPKLDPAFVDHSSVMRGAIPVLPLVMAWICLVLNVILPGAVEYFVCVRGNRDFPLMTHFNQGWARFLLTLS